MYTSSYFVIFIFITSFYIDWTTQASWWIFGLNDHFDKTINSNVQGKKLFFHFTRPSAKYFADFGCPNIKSTRPKKIKRCQKRFRRCDLYYILCKLSTPDLTKLEKNISQDKFYSSGWTSTFWVSVVQGQNLLVSDKRASESFLPWCSIQISPL